jgi:hypothetical protein
MELRRSPTPAPKKAELPVELGNKALQRSQFAAFGFVSLKVKSRLKAPPMSARTYKPSGGDTWAAAGETNNSSKSELAIARSSLAANVPTNYPLNREMAATLLSMDVGVNSFALPTKRGVFYLPGLSFRVGYLCQPPKLFCDNQIRFANRSCGFFRLAHGILR